MVQILVIGSLNMDLAVKVVELPQPGETIKGSAVRHIPGGKGANQAVAAAKIGATTSLIGRVGQDEYGMVLLESLKSNGVDITNIHRESQAATGVALITIANDGGNSIVVCPGANQYCGPKDIQVIHSLQPQAVIAQLEIPLETVSAAFRIAKEQAALTVLNPSPFCPLPPALLHDTDFIIVNEVEAALLSQLKTVDYSGALPAARKILTFGPQRCIVTLGANGAVYAGPEGEMYQAAFPVRAVDSTAAGDSFTAALIASYLRDKDIRLAMRFAAAAGALTTLSLGAQASLPSRSEVEEFLTAHPPDAIENTWRRHER